MATYTLTIKNLIKNDVNIFDFEYPIFDESYRGKLEKKIIDHYYYREIGLETVGMFKKQLETKMNEIMDYYNDLYKSTLIEQDVTSNYDVTETFTRENRRKDLFSDTPQGRTNIDDTMHISNINQGDGSEEWSRTMKGNIGVQTISDLIMKYRDSLINVDMMIISELNELFMGVY